MFKPFLLASVAASIVCGETTTVVDKNSHPTRPLNFVVVSLALIIYATLTFRHERETSL